MALRARLGPPTPLKRQEWPWHSLDSQTVSVSIMSNGDRRLEAETYLSLGFALRAAIEGRSHWKPLAEVARVWMPGRLKGIQVSRDIGTPFLTATQVFDIRPVPRKWLALDKTPAAESRFVSAGQILITCSGSVGRPIVALNIHENTIISHDILRVDPHDQQMRGWVYAFLMSPQSRAMATGSHYGHIIKHLEPSHLDALPFPKVSLSLAENLNQTLDRLCQLRNKAHELTKSAENLFEKALGVPDARDAGESGFVSTALTMTGGTRRLDANRYNPLARDIDAHLRSRAESVTAVRDAGYDVWIPGRYKRVPAEDGVVYWDSEDLITVNPDLPKRYADCQFGDERRGRIKRGWILIPSSGQLYGIIGTAVIATPALDHQVASNHVIRVAPREATAIRQGYLAIAMSHPTLGMPRIKALPFGSSVPEISPDDIAAFPIPRIAESDENAIADLAESASDARGAADLLEQEMAQEASRAIDQFIAGRVGRYQPSPHQLARRVLDAVAPET